MYKIDWVMNYVDLQQIPIIIPDKQAIQILNKVKKQNNIKKNEIY